MWERDIDDVAACFVCGCTDDVACPGGCSWVQDAEADMLDVCSRCVDLRDQLAELGRPVSLQQLAERTGEERDVAARWAGRILDDAGFSIAPEPAWLGGLGS